MRFLTAALFLFFIALLPGAAMAANAHQFDFVSIDGSPLPLAAYSGKAVLVVNTASMCGYTPQYKGLQSLWEEYRDKGLVVLGVPSNDFGGQEPGSEAEIKDFCEVNFAVDFPMTAKVPVSGAKAHPFYLWAASEKGAPRWNFHKYLIGPNGALLDAYPSDVRPDSPSLKKAIDAALAR